MRRFSSLSKSSRFNSTNRFNKKIKYVRRVMSCWKEESNEAEEGWIKTFPDSEKLALKKAQ